MAYRAHDVRLRTASRQWRPVTRAPRSSRRSRTALNIIQAKFTSWSLAFSAASFTRSAPAGPATGEPHGWPDAGWQRGGSGSAITPRPPDARGVPGGNACARQTCRQQHHPVRPPPGRRNVDVLDMTGASKRLRAARPGGRTRMQPPPAPWREPQRSEDARAELASRTGTSTRAIGPILRISGRMPPEDSFRKSPAASPADRQSGLPGPAPVVMSLMNLQFTGVACRPTF
jgi:hypothetical protein